MLGATCRPICIPLLKRKKYLNLSSGSDLDKYLHGIILFLQCQKHMHLIV